MPEGFLSSEEYDEQAHQLYNDGDYEGALEMLKEGLALYPNAVDLYVGMGYARLARVLSQGHLAGEKGAPRFAFDDLADGLAGHAWVEVANRVISDHQGVRTQYLVLEPGRLNPTLLSLLDSAI